MQQPTTPRIDRIDGRDWYVFNCARCGAEASCRKGEWDKGQRHCSHRCSKFSRSAAVEVPSLDPGFGFWFAGLTDGEGCFLFTRSKGHTWTRFQIALRSDDADCLQTIQSTLGFGKLYSITPKQVTKAGEPVWPKTVFTVQGIAGCSALCHIFSAFPLRSKKARDFCIWADAIAELTGPYPQDDILDALVVTLKESRRYNAPFDNHDGYRYIKT